MPAERSCAIHAFHACAPCTVTKHPHPVLLALRNRIARNSNKDSHVEYPDLLRCLVDKDPIIPSRSRLPLKCDQLPASASERSCFRSAECETPQALLETSRETD